MLLLYDQYVDRYFYLGFEVSHFCDVMQRFCDVRYECYCYQNGENDIVEISTS